MAEQTANGGAGGAGGRDGRGQDEGRDAARVRRELFGFDGGDLLPDVTSDERDSGWGDERGGNHESRQAREAADLRRFLDEKPPHHL